MIILKETQKREGVWAIDVKKAPMMIKDIEALRKKWWNIVGDDHLYDLIDDAIFRIKELIKANK